NSSSMDPVLMRRNIGYIIQNAGLFPHKTVIDNVCSVLFLKKENKKNAYKRAQKLLNLVGLGDEFAMRYPWQLSGGQQQRVGVARALSVDPDYMLMDEPFSAVDPIMRAQMQTEFLRLQSEISKTIILVTHDIDEAIKLGDKIVILKQGGRLAQSCTPEEILNNPVDKFVLDFAGNARGYQALSFKYADENDITSCHYEYLEQNSNAKPGDWVVVLDSTNKPLGWQRIKTENDTIKYDSVRLAHSANVKNLNYRTLLDLSLSSPNGKAIVVKESGEYLGVLESRQISNKLQETASRDH